MAARLGDLVKKPFPVGTLDITLYRDDLQLRSPRALGATDVPPGGIDGRLVRTYALIFLLRDNGLINAGLRALGVIGRYIVERLVDPGPPVRVSYRLTSRGRALA